jgi:uncharacterized protein
VTSCSIVWRRIDAPGHDACRVDAVDDGWRVHGTAVSCFDRMPTRLDYEVTCDGRWRTRGGAVRGWVGAEQITSTIERTRDGRWRQNGDFVVGLEACVDLDFGFTPATNLVQLRREALAVGAAADVPVAWLDVSAGTLSRLDQHYRRVAEDAYAYEAARFDYRAVLEVDACGFVRRYPGLWEAEC